MFEDRTIICRNCGEEFVFSAGEQEYFASKGLHDPLNCKECRAARKRAKNPGERVFYDAICAECGEPARIPFEPKEGRPVYCSTCQAKRLEAAKAEAAE